jgi:hypothetical protein
MKFGLVQVRSSDWCWDIYENGFDSRVSLTVSPRLLLDLACGDNHAELLRLLTHGIDTEAHYEGLRALLYDLLSLSVILTLHLSLIPTFSRNRVTFPERVSYDLFL